MSAPSTGSKPATFESRTAAILVASSRVTREGESRPGRVLTFTLDSRGEGANVVWRGSCTVEWVPLAELAPGWAGAR